MTPAVKTGLSQSIGQTVFLIGVLLYAISIMWGFMTARSQPSNGRNGLDATLLFFVLLPCFVACDSSERSSGPHDLDSLLW